MSDELVGIRVRTNFAEAIDWLNMMATRQVPFATAKALTMTARDVRDTVRSDLPQHFHLRGPGLANGLRIVSASKADWPHCKAQAGSILDFMELQETGGTKRPQKGAKNIAIPTKATDNRRSSGGRLPVKAKPRALLDMKSVFVGDHVIRKRLRKVGGKQRGTPTLALFLLRRETTIKPRFEFRKTAEGVVGKVYAKNFRQAFEDAIKAPKKPGRLK